MSIRFRHWTTVLASVLVLVGYGGAVKSYAQPDSVRAEILTAKGYSPDHSPRGALLRGAAVPGWGQLYNRQYYKIPFVYAGLAALGFRAYRAHLRYKLFQRAHLFAIGRRRAGENEPNAYQQFEGEYRKVVEEQFVREGQSGSRQLQNMRDQRDQFRRKRDLSLVGTGVFYALTLLDAYVSAHLLTFDVGENLSIRVQPVGAQLADGREAMRMSSHVVSIPTARLGRPDWGVHVRMRF